MAQQETLLNDNLVHGIITLKRVEFLKEHLKFVTKLNKQSNIRRNQLYS